MDRRTVIPGTGDKSNLERVFADRGDMRAYSNSFLPETEIIQRARQRGNEIGTYDTTPAVGSLLRYLTHLIGATSIVEIGTGAGVSGLWIFQAMTQKGLLTSIDDEVENAKLAKQAFDEAGISASRNADLLESVENAYRSLRPGGILVIDRALLSGKVADPTQRDPESIGYREVIKVIKESQEHWLPMLLPVGDGVMVATKI
jgi:predicted O-methyltransferase YrrM